MVSDNRGLSMIDLDLIVKKLNLSEITPLARDVSPREYYRVARDNYEYVLMVYHDVNAATVREINSFLCIGEWLDALNVKVPNVYCHSQECGYILLEDLGSVSFGAALREDKYDALSLYMLGCDVLKIAANAVSMPKDLPLYENSRIHANRRQLIDYYFPLERGKMSSEDIVAEFLLIWDEIAASLPQCPRGFVHGDFHLENLMLCDREQGVKRCGVIDFQDALNGFLPYDLVNLLEDARVDVPEIIKREVLQHYTSEMSAEEKAVFLSWYRVLGTQFHGRVLGLFIKLSAEQNRDKYLVHINRLQNYMIEGLKDPILHPLKRWFDKQGVDFSPIKDLNGDAIRTVFGHIAS